MHGNMIPERGEDIRSWAVAAWPDPSRALAPMLGSSGYALPEIGALEWNQISPDLGKTNISVIGGGGHNNWLLAPLGFSAVAPLALNIQASARNNLIIIGEGCKLFGELHIYNSGCIAVFGESMQQASALYVRMWSSDQLLFWGAGSTSNGTHIQIQGDGKKVIVGEDCLFSSNIYIRNSDMHAIVDMRTGAHTNPPGFVHIEPHVWVGQDALILKNTHLGFGSIIGAKSIVTRDVPRFAMAAGTPAEVIRRDVSWDRREIVRPETVAHLRDWAAELD